MMTKQSIDFILGYVFARIDRSMFKHFWQENRKDTLLESHSVPKIWFGLTSSKDITNDINGTTKYEMAQKLKDTLNALYPKLEIVCEKIIPENQYITFYFKVKYREVIKKMTVEEIEKELGYKIEIVSDK